ncbi:MAG TPA: DMT family transporter [Myxococcota bacterium]|nr:DMT family transporter [Myxococcota bacterium]MDP6242436.1 DMT family transporter [Myxococcota bacterium]MDP7076535.1 DMT family transporter [Myxococcota bacterium]HJO24358.1 DMT family transporter [Myxococcota bacterium]
MTSVEITLVLLSALLHAVWSTSIKASGDPLSFNLLQGGVTLVLGASVLPFIDYAALPSGLWKWLALSCLAHGVYAYWLSRAFEHGDLTLVYPIARSTPAILPLVAVPLLGEHITAGGALGIGVVVAGMWLVQVGASLDWRSFGSPAAGFALLTLASTVGYSLSDKAAMTELAASPVPGGLPPVLVFYVLMSVGHFVPFVPLVLLHRGARAVAAAARKDLVAASVASLIGFLGYGLILKTLETAPASYVVAVRQTSVLFVLVLGIVRLHERPGRARILGAAVTVVGVALIAWLGK